jgi:hypothetical protein
MEIPTTAGQTCRREEGIVMPKHDSRHGDEAGLQVTLEAHGPTEERIARVEEEVRKHPAVLEKVGKARWRLLITRLLEEDPEEKPRVAPAPADRFVTTGYDYTNDRALEVKGSLRAARRRLDIEDSAAQPWPTYEEFNDAVRILRRHPDLGPGLREGRLHPYRPMPPVVAAQRPDGRPERTLAVGLDPLKGETGHEIVGVRMAKRSVVRFPNGAPPSAQVRPRLCGLPDAAQPYVSGAAGQAWVTISQGGKVLWKFLVVRPAGSSGTNGSGIELKFVDYKGKRVLYKAHVPILNIKYGNDECGPFRDRQDVEGKFQAKGFDPVPAFRLCSAPATTILDSGFDAGKFNGVAVYVQGQEVVLVSEMEAGWYRYISQWRLATDGTIRARFGFSSVRDSCVCFVHHHHVYWRFDFDIVTAGHNRVQEFNDPALPEFAPSNWHDTLYEVSRPRDPSTNRKWRVDNTATGEAYDVVPGPEDGEAASSPDWPFPKGDVWIVRYHGGEIDDGSVAWGPPYEAGVDGWVNGESVLDQDVVLWYGAHFSHDIGAEPPGHFGEWVGPDLVPVSW